MNTAIIDLVAPSGKTRASEWPVVKEWCESRGLIPRFSPEEAFGSHPLFAHNIEAQLAHFKRACDAEDSDFIWCYQGGYGVTRLLPHLAQWPKPKKRKVLMGSSDITALLSFVHQAWDWTPIHGPCAAGRLTDNRLDESTLHRLEEVVQQRIVEFQATLQPLNKTAEQAHVTAPLVGGNLTVLHYLFGTPWQIKSKGAILILEDIDERAYKTALRLAQMQQLGLFDNIAGLIFGCFTHAKDNAEEHALTHFVLSSFAQEASFPVFITTAVGHGADNRPFVYGSVASLAADSVQQSVILD